MTGTDQRHDDLSPPDAEGMAQAERAIRRAGLLALALLAVAAGAAFAVLPRLVALPEDPVGRIVFALGAAPLVAVWVVVGVLMVSTMRRFSAHDIGGAAAGPPSPALAIPLAFLQNTLEQAAIAIPAYLALAALGTGRWLGLIVVGVVFFAAGRILFLRGYSRGAPGRALGMVLTLLPSLACYMAVFVLLVRRLV